MPTQAVCPVSGIFCGRNCAKYCQAMLGYSGAAVEIEHVEIAGETQNNQGETEVETTDYPEFNCPVTGRACKRECVVDECDKQKPHSVEVVCPVTKQECEGECDKVCILDQPRKAEEEADQSSTPTRLCSAHGNTPCKENCGNTPCGYDLGCPAEGGSCKTVDECEEKGCTKITERGEHPALEAMAQEVLAEAKKKLTSSLYKMVQKGMRQIVYNELGALPGANLREQANKMLSDRVSQALDGFLAANGISTIEEMVEKVIEKRMQRYRWERETLKAIIDASVKKQVAEAIGKRIDIRVAVDVVEPGARALNLDGGLEK